MKTLLRIITSVIVFFMFLFINLYIIGNTKHFKVDLSLKTLIQVAIADGEGGGACVSVTFFSQNYYQDGDVYLCWDMGEICGTQQLCWYEEGAGMCQSTECTNP
jgi:hypothetical protein